MKVFFAITTIATIGLFSSHSFAQSLNPVPAKHLYLDVHHVGAGKVSLKDAEGAHQKRSCNSKKIWGELHQVLG